MIGKTISHYKILDKIGEGGMGVVYKAQDLNLDRFVAIKFLPPHLSGDKEARKRFIHEAKAASALNHPNIGIVHEIDQTEDGHTFMVMAHYEGESLRDRIDRGNITVDEALDITSQIATGLAKAHGREIVHRDIKPSNVLLTRDGHAVIIDFGLAKLSGKTRLTKEGSTLGTAAFMSPEQAQGMEVDHRSDIFSVGTMLYEMLAEEPPFKGEHEAALLYGIVHETPEPVSTVKPELPPEIDLLVDKCLAKDRSERYQTAEELLSDIRKLKGGSAQGIGLIRSGDVRRATGKRKYLLAWGIPIVILAAIVIVLKIWAPGQSPDVTTAPMRPSWILVAEFEGPRDDPELAVAVRELVTATLNESRIVRPLSRSDLERGLQLAMKPDTTRIAGKIAQELAYRAGTRVYIEGQINRIGSGYTIVLNVMDSETGSYVFPVSGTAENADAIIPAVDRLNRELRGKLGENAEAIEATRGASDITTPSFDAYQKYVQAAELVGKGKQTEGKELAREALDLDPDFAAAWALIGTASYNMGYDDSALYAYEEALERPERLSEAGRLVFETAVVDLRCDLGEALKRLDILVSRYNQGHNYRGVILNKLGRLAEAVDMYRTAIETAPFGPSEVLLYNMTVTLIFLGRYDDAGEFISRMQGQWLRSYMQLLIASAMCDWARADSIAGSGQARLRSREKYFASRDAARGSMRSAAGHCDGMWDGEYISFDHNTCCWTLQLSVITGMDGAYCCWPECRDSSISGLAIQVMEAAHSGDTVSSRRVIDVIRQRPDYMQRRNAAIIALAEASLAAVNNRWDEIVQRLEPILEQYRPGLEQGFALLTLRWSLADALEKHGELEKAAEIFELVLSPELLWSTSDYLVRPSYCTYAHHRLVLIYSQLGRVAEARRHWEAFQELFTDPDPELEPMLAEARAAVARLEEQP